MSACVCFFYVHVRAEKRTKSFSYDNNDRVHQDHQAHFYPHIVKRYVIIVVWGGQKPFFFSSLHLHHCRRVASCVLEVHKNHYRHQRRFHCMLLCTSSIYGTFSQLIQCEMLCNWHACMCAALHIPDCIYERENLVTKHNKQFYFDRSYRNPETVSWMNRHFVEIFTRQPEFSRNSYFWMCLLYFWLLLFIIYEFVLCLI